MQSDAADVRYRRIIFALVLVAQFLPPVGLFGLGALAPIVRAALDLSREQVGYVSGLCAVGAACASIPTGWLADRVGVRWLLIAGQVLSGLALVLLLLLPTYGALLLGMLLVGVSHGAITVLTTIALAAWFPRERLATVMGAKFTALSGAGGVAGMVLPPLALWLGWRQTFSVVGGLLMASAVGALLGYRDRRQAPPTAPQVASARQRLWRNQRFWYLAMAGFVFGAAFYTFPAYLPLYLYERLGYSPIRAGSLLALAYGTAMASRLLYGWMSDRWFKGERLVLLRGMAAMATSALLVLVLLSPGTPVPILVVSIFLFGASGLSMGSLYQTLAVELAGRDTQGFAAGLAATLFQVGGTAISPMFGYLVDVTGAYTASWGLLALGLLLSIRLLGWVRLSPVLREAPTGL
jgi:nitrate/nitrite transporter NarK